MLRLVRERHSPAVTVPRESKKLHDRILVVIEFRVRLAGNNNRLYTLPLYFIQEE